MSQNLNWNLNDLYLGFDDKYQSDLEKLDKLMNDKIKLLSTENMDKVLFIESKLKLEEEIIKLAMTLHSYASLNLSTDVTNSEAMTYLSKVSRILLKSTKEDVKFTRFLTSVDLDELSEKSSIIKQYLFILKEEQTNGKYLLSEEEEVLYAKLQELSSRSWSQLQNIATANLETEVNGQKVTFSDLRNLAYSDDPNIRKEAYKKELEIYESVDDFVALALSNIKREVNIVNELRGYKNALEKTLLQSRMKEETLNAMIEAMKSYRIHFERYLKAKAKYLGHEKGLPWYDLFAPVGKLTKTYTFDEAKSLILDAFGSYSDELRSFAKKAFDNNWIDVLPKKGKRGGAFCSNQPQIGQSRFLLNFTGSLDNVFTLAHELGHGYHGEQIVSNPPLHWDYPMPLAETASIFCETIMKEYLLSIYTNDDEKLSILELTVQSDTQVIIDILSRFLFESKVFEEADRPISKNEMKQWMLDAQKEAYLEGLDHEQLHPYMWLVKGHYYSAGLNFYNFPYAFGLLFGKGLYANYLKNKEAFLEKYNTLLKMTTYKNAEEVAKYMDIDITKKDFWIDSLEMVKKDIDLLVDLFEKK